MDQMSSSVVNSLESESFTSTNDRVSPTVPLITDHFGKMEPLPLRFLTKPEPSLLNEKNRPYHARPGSSPFTYGVTAGSPALRRRRIHSESTAYICESVPRNSSSAIDSDLESNSVYSVVDNKGQPLTWLQRQQLKLKIRQEGKDLRTKEMVMAELKGSIVRQDYDDELATQSDCGTISSGNQITASTLRRTTSPGHYSRPINIQINGYSNSNNNNNGNSYNHTIPVKARNGFSSDTASATIESPVTLTIYSQLTASSPNPITTPGHFSRPLKIQTNGYRSHSFTYNNNNINNNNNNNNNRLPKEEFSSNTESVTLDSPITSELDSQIMALTATQPTTTSPNYDSVPPHLKTNGFYHTNVNYTPIKSRNGFSSDTGSVIMDSPKIYATTNRITTFTPTQATSPGQNSRPLTIQTNGYRPQTLTYSALKSRDGFSSDTGSVIMDSPVTSGVGFGSVIGRDSPSQSVYYGQSRRSSIASLSEFEVISQHPSFIKDTSKYWYKPNISRQEAINLLKNKPPGTFVIRDSKSFPGSFGLAFKVSHPPSNLPSNRTGAGDRELVRHYLIEPTSKGVRIKGCQEEPTFSSLPALIFQHSITALGLPCKLLIPDNDLDIMDDRWSQRQELLEQGAACNVLYLLTIETESLTGPQAIKNAVSDLLARKLLPTGTVVHFKVSSSGITLTDNSHKLFFRRHYPLHTVSHFGMDPDNRFFKVQQKTGNKQSSCMMFGFVARKKANNTDNECHLFAEYLMEQPASAIVTFSNRVISASSKSSSS